MRWVSGLTGVSAQSLAMEESDPEAEMSSSTRCTRVFHVQTELRLKSATQNIVQVGMKIFETEKNLVYAKLCNLNQLTVRWVIGLTGVSAHILAMAESDSEAGMSYSSQCTTGFPVQTGMRLKNATQNIVQVGMKTFETEKSLVKERTPREKRDYVGKIPMDPLKLKRAWFMPS